MKGIIVGMKWDHSMRDSRYFITVEVNSIEDMNQFHVSGNSPQELEITISERSHRSPNQV